MKRLINHSKFLLNNLIGRKRPVLASLNLTELCNHNCAMCPVSEKKTFEGDLSTEQWKKIIDKLSEYVTFYYLEGGEPTLRKDIVELIQYAHDIGLPTQLNTNGTLLHRVLPKCIGKIDTVMVSLDSGNKSTYIKQRGVDTFERVVENIRLASDMEFNTMVNCVITKHNVNEIASEKYFDFVKRTKAKTIGISLVESYPGIPYLLPGKKQIDAAMETILNYIKNDNDPPVIIAPSYFESIKKYGRPVYDECQVFNSANIDNKGNVIVPYWKCMKAKYPLLKHGISEIWDNTNWIKCNDCVMHCVYMNSRIFKLFPNLADLMYSIKVGRKIFGSFPIWLNSKLS